MYYTHTHIYIFKIFPLSIQDSKIGCKTSLDCSLERHLQIVAIYMYREIDTYVQYTYIIDIYITLTL